MATTRTMPHRKMGKRNVNKEQTLGDIRILSEKPVPYVELQLDMSQDTIDALAKAGWIEIQKDREALANYALVKALKEFVDAHGAR